MRWVAVIWSMGAGACLTLALINFVVWWKDRAARANLAFSLLATAVAVFAALELALMWAQTPEQFGTIVRWLHIPIWVMIASLVAFVRLYLRAGRWWLAAAVIGMRTLSLILNFAFWPNINYRQITALRHISFLGESVSVPTGVPNPWVLVAQLSLVLLFVFVLDATITAWRRGDRRQAVVAGGSILFVVALGTAQGVAIGWGLISMPITVSLVYQFLVAAMAYELSYDVIHAAALARQLQVSEAGLRESEERFRTVADAAPVLIWMSGTDKLCTFFNKPWLEFTGRSLEQEMGNGWAQGVHPDDLQGCLKTYTKAFNAREPFVMQYRLRRSDCEYRWISDNGVPRYDAQGKFAGYIGSCVDVTELLRKDEALREFEERVILAAEAAHLGVWEINIATNQVWMSDKARSLFQFDIETRIDHSMVQDRVHPEDRAFRDSAVNRAIETEGEYEIEYRILLPDGTLRWIGGRGRCVTAKEGTGTRLIGVSVDITPRKQAEEKFRLAVEASPSGIVLVSDGGEIVLVNAHIEELFGYRRDELVGKLVDILVPERFRAIHPVHRAKFLAKPEAAVIGAGRELFARRKDGTEFPVEIGLNPIKTADGTLILAAVVDITARKQAELETLRHREELAHLSRVAAMGELAASIAHELNQPLSGITINASTGQRLIDHGDPDLGELREVLSDIVADGRRAGEVIRGVQSMVKKDSSTRQRVNLNDVVTNVIRMVNPNAILRSCELDIFLEPNLPPIEGNPVQLQQVLLNLVINALDAIQDPAAGRRKVVIATDRTLNGAVRTSVRDYGTGIPEEAHDRMFEQFFTTKAKGLGMGLAIARSIVKSHGGSIAAENAEGGGARFYFTLPVTASRS